MRWRRGFFRLWIVASVVWAVGCTVLLQPWSTVERFSELQTEYRETRAPISGRALTHREMVRIKQNVQRMADAQENEPAIDRYIASEGATADMVRDTKLKPWERYYSGPVVTRDQAVAIASAGYRQQRREVIAFFTFTLAPIVLTLIFGVVVAWVVSGFRAPQT